MTNRCKACTEGLVFNIQRFSIHDGPGIRTTVFLKGCPLRCRWCSNPEGMTAWPEIIVNEQRCIHCGDCRESCSAGAIISIEGNKIERIDQDRCTECMQCVEICPSKALECVGSCTSVDKLVSEIRRDALFYHNSGGGVTVSGGEPLFQWRFTTELLRICKQEGMHTALDTTGFSPWEIFEGVLKYVDLVLYDIKHIDEEAHVEGTGVKNKVIMENFLKAAALKPIWLRFPVIPRFNDSFEVVEQIAQMGAEAGVQKVSLLPYHEWGLPKYERLGRTSSYIYSDTVSDDAVKRIGRIFQDKGLKVTLNQ